jgi:imidazolonepropionase-like amidohydrolase
MMFLGLEIPPIDVIRSATQKAAEALGISNQVGTIEVGKQADILVVEMNPLEDITRVGDVVLVMKSGKVVFTSGQLVA